MSLTESLIKHAFFLGGIVAENECITIQAMLDKTVEMVQLSCYNWHDVMFVQKPKKKDLTGVPKKDRAVPICHNFPIKFCSLEFCVLQLEASQRGSLN